MKFEVRSAAVYKDFEKIYKLVALYSADRSRLEPHVGHLDATLQKNLEDPEFEEGLIQFDFLMTAVFSEGKEIYRSTSPELTMAYALFCEGVRSIVATRGLSGEELTDWAMLLRRTFDPKNQATEDLASILWRNRFNHLRIQIYNALLSVDEIGLSANPIGGAEEAESFESFKAEQARLYQKLELESLQDPSQSRAKVGKSTSTLSPFLVRNIRDEFWSLPSAQKYFHATVALEAQEVEKLRNQLADAAYSDRAKNIVRFTSEEISALRSELEAYDSNHIEFNLLSQHFTIIEGTRSFESGVRSFLLRQIETLVKSVIGRFHAGLILFILRKLTALKEREDLKDFVSEVTKLIRMSLQKDENRKLILESLESLEGRKTAFEVLPFISKQEWPSLIDQIIASRRLSGLTGFLMYMKQADPDFEQSLYSFGPERLVAILPALKDIEWDKRSSFIIRCLQAKSSELVEAALKFLGTIEIPPEQSLTIFKRLADKGKATWIDSILTKGEWYKWANFSRSLLRGEDWSKGSDVTALWILRLALVCLGSEAVNVLKPWVEARRFRFWPQFARERDLILTSLLIVKLPAIKAEVQEIVTKESKLLFQSNNLKERLRSMR